jgi:hypothetical protein
VSQLGDRQTAAADNALAVDDMVDLAEEHAVSAVTLGVGRQMDLYS